MIYERFINKQSEEPIVYMSEWDIDLAPGVKYGPVIRDIYIVECCTDGYGSVVINGREFPVRPGSCFFLLPGDIVIHTTDKNTSRSGVWCAFDGLQAGRTLARAGITSEKPFAPQEAYSEICEHVQLLAEMKNESDPGADMRRTAHIYAIFGALLRRASAAGDKNLWIQKAVGIIEARYHMPITVKEIAGEVGLERSYFSTLFKEQTGITPHAYLNNLRVKKACTLMKQGKFTVAEIAAEVGLDYRNFARLFKSITGSTPREYNRM